MFILPVSLIPSSIHSTLIRYKERSSNCNMCKKNRHNMNAFCLLGLGPDLVTPMTKALGPCVFFFSFLLSLYPSQGSQTTKKETKKKKTSLDFFLLPSLFHWTCTHTPLSCTSPRQFAFEHQTTFLPFFRTYLYEEHRNEERKEGKKEWKECDSVSHTLFFYFFLYTPACVCLYVWMRVLSFLHREPTFALIPSPDCSVRCPFSDKERYIRPSVHPSVPHP